MKFISVESGGSSISPEEGFRTAYSDQSGGSKRFRKGDNTRQNIRMETRADEHRGKALTLPVPFPFFLGVYFSFH